MKRARHIFIGRSEATVYHLLNQTTEAGFISVANLMHSGRLAT
jgi:Fe2+ or Zn2+ uptake regulation protein